VKSWSMGIKGSYLYPKPMNIVLMNLDGWRRDQVINLFLPHFKIWRTKFEIHLCVCGIALQGKVEMVSFILEVDG
jgi:hypothetical protein